MGKTDNNKNFFRFGAFTLAEVLITLSILGIVAVISIPSIFNIFKERSNIIKLKRSYSQLQQAFDLAYVNYGEPTSWNNYKCDGDTPVNNSNACRNNNYSGISLVFGKFLPLQKKCTINSYDDNCYLKENDDNQKHLSGTGTPDYNKYKHNSVTRYLLKNGAFIAVRQLYENDKYDTCNYMNSSSKQREPKAICSMVYIDVNGKTEPNTYGKDIFIFWLTKTGIIPTGGNSWYYSHNSDCSNKTKNGTTCAAWALYKGNMNYLRKNTSW